MYLHDVLASLARRWYLVLVGMMLTLYLCSRVAGASPVVYAADGSVLLLPPPSSLGDTGNPYLYLGGLGQAVDVLVARLNSDRVSTAVSAVNPGTVVTAVRDTTTTGPIIRVTSTGSDGSDSLAATRVMMDVLPAELAALQTELGVQPDSMIGSMDLTTSDEATPDQTSRTRLTLTAAGGGLVLTILAAGLLDGLLRSRRNGADSSQAAPVEAKPGPRPGTVPDARRAKSPSTMATRADPLTKHRPSRTGGTPVAASTRRVAPPDTTRR